jgi:hypothetical protein
MFKWEKREKELNAGYIGIPRSDEPESRRINEKIGKIKAKNSKRIEETASATEETQSGWAGTFREEKKQYEMGMKTHGNQPP